MPLRTTVYVISLKSSNDRREAFERQARHASQVVKWKFFDAHQTLSADLNYVETEAIVARGRPMHPGELGVYSSHYAVWKAMIEERVDQGLVLEDDVVIDWDFIAELIYYDLSKINIEYLKLYNKNITSFKILSNNFLYRWLIDCRGFAYGAQAYLLTRRGAELFLRICKQVSRPIDDQMDRSWAHGVPNLAVFPFPAFERFIPSTIGNTRYMTTSLSFELLVRRILCRVLERLLRLRQSVTGYGRRRTLGTHFVERINEYHN